MDSWFDITNVLARIQNQYSRLLPDMQLLTSIQQSEKIIESILKPQRDLVAQLTQFDNHLQSPISKQIAELVNLIKVDFPKYSNSFLIATTTLNAFIQNKIIVPEIFQKYKDINMSIINSTTQFSIELQKINSTSFSKPIILDNIPTQLVSPFLSGISQFQLLENMGYINLNCPDEIKSEYTELIDENCSITEVKIRNINPDWLILLHGAQNSLNSRNPDKIRHTIASLRELITQILHYFSPDDEVKRKYQDEKYYNDGKPTRRTRIEYILMNKYENTPLVEIIDKDISSILALFDIYQKGTHEVISFLNDDDLLYILKRTELVIEQLL